MLLGDGALRGGPLPRAHRRWIVLGCAIGRVFSGALGTWALGTVVGELPEGPCSSHSLAGPRSMQSRRSQGVFVFRFLGRTLVRE